MALNPTVLDKISVEDIYVKDCHLTEIFIFKGLYVWTIYICMSYFKPIISLLEYDNRNNE